MTRLLETALAAVRREPESVQDQVASAMLSLIADAPPDVIDPAHLSAVLEGLAQLRNGDFASREDVAAAFRSFDG